MAHELKSGDQFGRYEIKHLLGRGGMSDVYLAYDPMLDREVAVKVLPPEFSRNEERARRFGKEVRAVAALNHHNIVTIYQVGEQDGCQFCTMALLPGGDLRKRLKKGLKTSEALKIAAQVATALGHAHQRGLIHRDIKPGNIMFDESDNAIVVDFGIAKVLDSDTHLTGTGKSIGTPHYMSPEQAQGMSTIDGRSDIYSLGIVLYEMLTGKVPFDADNTIGIAFKHVQEEAPPLPRELAEYQPLMDRMLCKQPENRFATAEDAAIEIAAQRASVAGGITKTSMIERRRTPTPGARTAYPPAADATTQRRSAKKKASKKVSKVKTKSGKVSQPTRGLPTRPAPTIPTPITRTTTEQLAAKPGARFALPVLISIASLIAIAVIAHMTWRYFNDETPTLAGQDATNSGSANGSDVRDSSGPELLVPEPPQDQLAQDTSDQTTPTTDLINDSSDDSQDRGDVDGDNQSTQPIEQPVEISAEEQRLEQVRRLASDRIGEAEQALRDADAANASRYAPVAYNRARSILDDARAALLQSGDPDQAAEVALRAREEAAMAIGMAEGAIETEQALQARIPEAEQALSQAEAVGARDYAPDLFERASAAIADARASMQRLDFAAAEQEIDTAIRRANDAQRETEIILASAAADDSNTDSDPGDNQDDTPTIADQGSDTDVPGDGDADIADEPVLQPPVDTGPSVGEQVATLLASAEDDYQALRLTRPAGNNALDKYNQILSLDPGNPDATAGIGRIASRYLDLARNSLSAGRWDEAVSRTNQARRLDPELAGVELLLEQIELARSNAGPATGEVFSDRLNSGGQAPEMIVIGPGNFVMGSGAGADYERPATPITIPRAIAMSRRETTVGDFKRFVQQSGYRSLAERSDGCIQWLFGWRRQNESDWRNPGFEQNDDHPVTCVSIDDAQAYADWLSQQTGHRYRLPSEAEWEYAARANGTAMNYWQSDPSEACQSANISDLTRADDHGLERSSDNVFMCRDGAIQTDASGTRNANAMGLWDMLGNLEEWTADCWNPNHRGAGDSAVARTDGDCSQAVVRGGSWHTLPSLVKVTYRASAERSARTTTTGFRLVREMD